MALTPWRWVALALVGFGLAPVIILEDANAPEWSWTERSRLVERQRVATSNLRDAVNQLRITQVRDSVLRAAARSRWPVYAVDAALDLRSRAIIDSMVRALSPERASAARVPTSVFFVLDSARKVAGHDRRGGSPGALSIDYVLPDDSTRRCTVIARVRVPTTRKNYEAELRSVISRERLLGPCAYLERFGMPGVAIRKWLDARGWQFAQRAVWTEPAMPWLAGTPDSAFRTRIDLSDIMSPAGRACAGGEDRACLAALEPQQPNQLWRTPMQLRAGMISTGSYSPFVHGDRSWFSRSWPLGAREWTLLSDMVRAMGAESFERFWTSDLPPSRAFEAASGQTLAGWTRTWIEDTYHPQASGPSLPAYAAVFAFVLVTLGLALTIGAARRRQIA